MAAFKTPSNSINIVTILSFNARVQQWWGPNFAILRQLNLEKAARPYFL